MAKENSSDPYQDVITFEPIPVKIVRDAKTINIFYDPNYWTTLIVLRDRPMTVRDLEKAYKKEAEKNEAVEPKSDKTIYRYLKVLQKAGLVVAAGQRVVVGKMVTETLFARTANFFLLVGHEPKWWKSKDGKKRAQRIGKLLSYLLDSPEPTLATIQEALMLFDQLRETQLENLGISEDKEIQNLMSMGSLKELKDTAEYVGVLAAFMKSPDLLGSFRSAFESKHK